MKNKGLIIAAVILAAIAGYFIISNKTGTIQQELRDFAVEDTASLYKIFLADKGSKQALLERQDDGSWTVNGKYKARKDAIRVLLETLKRMDVKAPVAKAAHDNVIKSMAAGAIKVELYIKGDDEPFKVIYVGGETPDHLGTYMLLENSSAPFVMQIPGFNGYLSSRFVVSEEGWRDRAIFNFSSPLEELAYISLEVLDKPDESFKMELSGGQVTSVSGLKNNISIDYDTAKVLAYVSRFTQIGFESVVTGLQPEKADSILKAVPMYILNVRDRAGIEKSIILHPMAASSDQLDINGKPLKYHPDRLYAQVVSAESNDFVVAQYYVFDRFIKPISFFRK